MEASQEPPTTDSSSPKYFLNEWVTGVFYGGRWHDVKEGTFRESIAIEEWEGEMCVYLDPFDDQIIFLVEPISGYRVKKPEPLPSPEPQATVTELYPKK